MNNAHFDLEGGGITLDEWREFCAAHAIEYAPTDAGRNVYRYGGRTGVECAFGTPVRGENAHQKPLPDFAEFVAFQAPFKRDDLVKLVQAFWIRFGGAMYADAQTRELICAG